MRGAWANCRRAAPASNAGNGLRATRNLRWPRFCLIWVLFRLRHFSRPICCCSFLSPLFVVLAVVHGTADSSRRPPAPAPSAFMSKAWRAWRTVGQEQVSPASVFSNRRIPAHATSTYSDEPLSLSCCARRAPERGKKPWRGGCWRPRPRTKSADGKQAARELSGRSGFSRKPRPPSGEDLTPGCSPGSAVALGGSDRRSAVRHESAS